MTWGTGSQGQIITSINNNHDYDSYFQIKEGLGQTQSETGNPVKCDDIVRLEHVNTSKNLHSHNFPSYITDSQEVTAFGQNGSGDLNDNWQLICYNSDKEYLYGKTNFFLKHTATDMYLYVNLKKSLFNEYNCRGCPIMGHREVSCTGYKDKQSLWKITGGMLFNGDENKIKLTSDL